MRKSFLASFLALAGFLLWQLLACPGIAQAYNDVMPPPQRAPRLAVEAVPLKEARSFAGKARAVDGGRVLLEGHELRLFGIIAPNLSSNYGVQARTQLDQLLRNPLSCSLVDREKDGRPVVFCASDGVPDIAYALLKNGWAMVDRKAVKGSSVADAYEQAEQAAQSANQGVFARVQPTPQANPIAVTEVAKPSQDKGASLLPTPLPTATRAAEPVLLAASTLPQPSILERFQSLIGTLLILSTAALFGYAFMYRDHMRVVEQRRALAAALRGELVAACNIARTRAYSLANRKPPAQEVPLPPSQLWPRLRSAVYQSQVGGISVLGVDLASAVANIYGQCADYAAYHHGMMTRMPSHKAVSDALYKLADQMEVVVGRLARLEAGESVVEAGRNPEKWEPEKPLRIVAAAKSLLAKSRTIAAAPAAPDLTPATHPPEKASPKPHAESQAVMQRDMLEKLAETLRENAVDAAEPAAKTPEAKTPEAKTKVA